MKLQVNVSQEVVDEIDVIANRLGVSRSAWCALVIGEALDNRRKVSDIMNTLQDTLAASFQQEQKRRI